MCGLTAGEPRRPHRPSSAAKPVRQPATKAAKSRVTPALTVSRQPVLFAVKPAEPAFAQRAGPGANERRTDKSFEGSSDGRASTAWADRRRQDRQAFAPFLHQPNDRTGP